MSVIIIHDSLGYISLSKEIFLTFISYAQNFEDVILNRVLSDIKVGFYIDVGASHHTVHSVTKAFYDNGWCGINIEPISFLCQEIARHRPRDINLQICARNCNGESDFYHTVGLEGIPTMNYDLAQQHNQ